MKSLRDFIFILGCNKIKLIKFWILVKQEKFVYQITLTHPLTIPITLMNGR